MIGATRPLSAETLLLAWDQGRACHPIDRSVMLHGLAAPELAPDAVADRPLGERNSALLRLRLATFGARLRAYLDCPSCGERLEFEADAPALLAEFEAAADAAEASGFEVAGQQFRAPSSRDLAAVVDERDPESAVLQLLRRCLVAPTTLDDTSLGRLIGEVDETLERVDPMSECRLDFRCVDCGHAWASPFDIASYLWAEIEAYACRLLDEVDVLARAYGWTEATILALSDARRAAYLERVRA